MTALPPVAQLPPLFQLGSQNFDAYTCCLTFEAVASTDESLHGRFTEQIAARLLGYLLIHCPTDSGRDALSREITSCPNNKKLYELGDHYFKHFIRCFKSAKGPTPVPSHHPSRPSFDDMQEMLGYLLEEAPKGHQRAKDMALIRDGFRCCLTKCPDVFHPNLQAPPPPGVQWPQDFWVDTRLCHIFPQSTNYDISGDNEGGPKYNYAATVWAVMERLGGIMVDEELNGVDINKLENVFTMEPSRHGFFDALSIWFNETPVPNQYNVEAIAPRFLSGVIQPVTFTTPDPVSLPVPSPRYLRLHAAAAKVAHLSGAGECMDHILKDITDTSVMADSPQFAAALIGALNILPRETTVGA